MLLKQNHLLIIIVGSF